MNISTVQFDYEGPGYSPSNSSIESELLATTLVSTNGDVVERFRMCVDGGMDPANCCLAVFETGFVDLRGSISIGIVLQDTWDTVIPESRRTQREERTWMCLQCGRVCR
jgi:hypothetical protein